jgi:7-cyano-7-deazaguanine synthase in queuosine biosynthesis
MSVLINFSGGLDSLYILLNTLSTTSEKVILHHCKIANLEGRRDVEHKSVISILDELNLKYPDRIKYIETSFDCLKTGYVIRDIEIIAFMNGIILRNSKYQDILKILVSANAHDESNDPTEVSVVRRREILDIIGPNKNESRLLDFPMLHMTKKEIIDYIPDELLKKSWYCRKPIGYSKEGKIISPLDENVDHWINCKRCKTCLQVLEAVGKDHFLYNKAFYI